VSESHFSQTLRIVRMTMVKTTFDRVYSELPFMEAFQKKNWIFYDNLSKGG